MCIERYQISILKTVDFPQETPLRIERRLWVNNDDNNDIGNNDDDIGDFDDSNDNIDDDIYQLLE
jgi:hypothetical protein